MRGKIEGWLSQGISPERLALTLALGFAIGCLPMIGVPTALCLLIALGLRLNVPAIQAANYAAMPLQIALIVPFVRLGGWMFASSNHGMLSQRMLGQTSPLTVIWASGSLASQAFGAWLVTAIPMVLLITLVLTPLLRRLPVLAKAQSGD